MISEEGVQLSRLMLKFLSKILRGMGLGHPTVFGNTSNLTIPLEIILPLLWLLPLIMHKYCAYPYVYLGFEGQLYA